MPIRDLFKTKAELEAEAKRAADETAKTTKENAELERFKGKRQLEGKINDLKIEKEKLKKQYQTIDNTTKEASKVLADFKFKSKELDMYENALLDINDLENKAMGGTIGAQALNEIVFKILGAVNVLAKPEVTGGLTEDEKIRIEMELDRNIRETTSSAGGINTLKRLADSARQGTSEVDEMSDEDAIAEIMGGGPSGAKKKIKELDAKINNLKNPAS